tara:strand:+ start:2427 stop:5774 length:3348 start_codon:yes stop_codon:yes gene_type:complete
MGLNTLTNIYKEKGEDFLKRLFDSYVIVTEQINGSRFLFQKQFDDTITYYKKDGEVINYIDRSLMSFYEKAINYIESINPIIIEDIPDNWTFGFQYFPSMSPIKIAYDKLPKNNLVLTDISIRNEAGRVIKVINDTKILNDWSKKLGVQEPPVIFEGLLSSEQKDKIREFLKYNETDLDKLFKTKSFSRYIISILNPSLSNTALSNSLDKDIDAITFKFIKTGTSDTFSAKMIDPVFHYSLKNLKSKKERISNDMYQIAMLDIVEFIEQYDLSKIALTTDTQEERFVELISALFNEYVSHNGHKYVGINFDTPEFAKRPEFALNVKFIRNERTKEIIRNDYMCNLFKIMLSSFRKYRKNATNILTDTIIKSINEIVDKLENKVREKSKANAALDFETFIKSNKFKEEPSIFEKEIFEGLSLDYKDQGLKKVNFIVGRFQPFTLGHVKVFEQIYKQNGYPVVVCIIKGKKQNLEKNPFNEDIQTKLFARMEKQYKFLESIKIIYGGAGIDSIFNVLRPAYEPVLWGTGTDRMKGYQYQIDRYSDEINPLEEFGLYEIKRTDENISATKVRNALKIDDFESFKKMTPKSIHRFYEELQNILEPVQEYYKPFLITEHEEAEPINEAKLHKTWLQQWKKWSEGIGTINTSSFVGNKFTREMIRADFGSNDGTALTNIQDFLKSDRVNPNNYKITEIPPKEYVDDISSDISGEFSSYKIEFTKPSKVFIEKYDKGSIIYVTNRNKIAKSTGKKEVVGRKDFTPEAMGLTIQDYKSPEPLYANIQRAVEKSNIPDNYKAFMIKSAQKIIEKNKNTSKFKTFEDYSKYGKEIIYKLDADFFDGIDARSIKNLQNDYGEVLGGLMLFDILKDTGAGVRYPSGSNEALIDFYFDDYKISSKAGGGSNPSGSTAMRAIENRYTSGDIVFDEEESEFYEQVVKNWLNPMELAKSGTYSSVMTLGYIHNGKSSAIKYLMEESGLDINALTQDNVLKFLDGLTQDESSFFEFYSNFIELSGAGQSLISESYRQDYIKRMKSNNHLRIGLIFYPIMVETSIALSEKYSNVLTRLVQKITDVKQVYMDSKIRSSEFVFKTYEFKTSNFKFERKGAVWNPYSAMMSISLVK